MTTPRPGERFARAGGLRRGYDVRQVDAFLSRIRAAHDEGDVAGRASAQAIRRTGFDLVRRGYQVGPVDGGMDALEQRALILATGGVEDPWRARDAGMHSTKELTETLTESLTGRYGGRFPRTGRLRRGYHRGEVDVMTDRLAGAVGAGEALDPVVVREVVFHPRLGGYDEDAVDDALDAVVEILLRRASVPPVGSHHG